MFNSRTTTEVSASGRRPALRVIFSKKELSMWRARWSEDDCDPLSRSLVSVRRHHETLALYAAGFAAFWRTMSEQSDCTRVVETEPESSGIVLNQSASESAVECNMNKNKNKQRSIVDRYDDHTAKTKACAINIIQESISNDKT